MGKTSNKIGKRAAQDLRAIVEYVLQRGDREDVRRATTYMLACAYDADLKNAGFNVECDGPITRITPPKNPSEKARQILEAMGRKPGETIEVVRNAFV
jgi:hypothetical protein